MPLFCMVLLTTSYELTAQVNKLSGFVFGPSNEPLVGASVIVDGTQLGTVTDVHGAFQITDIKNGEYTISTSYIGYKTESKKIAVHADTQVKFNLMENAAELSMVVIQGTTEKTKIEKEGFAVDIIDTKEAGQRNIQTNELLNSSVGVKIRQNGGLGSNVEYSLNGLSGSAVRIFIDGIPISTFGSSFNLNSIPPSMIDRIEIYKGVVPGHLSDDALGGAINIVLKSSTNNHLNASVSYGSFNTLQASFNGLYRYDNSGFTVKASGFHNYSDNDYKVSGRSVLVTGLGGVQTPITARRFNDAYSSTGGVIQLGYTDVKWADQFYIGYTGSSNYKEIQHGAFMTISPYEGRFTQSEASLVNLSYQKQDLFTKDLDLTINGYYGKRNTQVIDTVTWAYNWAGERAIDFRGNEYKYSWGSQQEGGPTEARIDRNVASIRTGLSYSINDHHKILFNHVHNRIDREDSDKLRSVLENTFLGTRDLYKNIVALTYEVNAFDERLKTSLFGKYYQQKTISVDPAIEIGSDGVKKIVDEVVSSNKINNGYGFALSYAIIPEITLLTSAEKAVRLPNETEIFGSDGDNVVANSSINPELSKNFNLGFRFGSFKLNNHQLVVTTNLFTRNIKDRIGLPIETSLNVDDELILYVNQGSGTSKGIDLQFNYTYNKKLFFNFNVSKFDLKIENRGVEIDVPNTPFHTMNANLQYSFKDLIQKKSKLDLFYSLSFTDEFSYIVPQGSNTVGDDFFKVPNQLAQDLGVSYTLPKKDIVVSFDVKNIFDKPVYDNLSVQKPGRAFYLKLNYSIYKF